MNDRNLDHEFCFCFSTTASEYTHKQSRAGAAQGQESQNLWRFIDSIPQIVTHGFFDLKKKNSIWTQRGIFQQKSLFFSVLLLSLLFVRQSLFRLRGPVPLNEVFKRDLYNNIRKRGWWDASAACHLYLVRNVCNARSSLAPWLTGVNRHLMMTATPREVPPDQFTSVALSPQRWRQSYSRSSTRTYSQLQWHQTRAVVSSIGLEWIFAGSGTTL